MLKTAAFFFAVTAVSTAARIPSNTEASLVSNPLPYNWGVTEKTRVFKYYDLLASIFIVVLIISNLLGQKICAFGPVRVSGAQLLFPITYIFGDVFTEVYGYGGSRRVIWTGFLANALMAILGNVIWACRARPK